jgi:hypothetical protein
MYEVPPQVYPCHFSFVLCWQASNMLCFFASVLSTARNESFMVMLLHLVRRFGRRLMSVLF